MRDTRSEDFEDLMATLHWAATLELTREQRAEVVRLCNKLTGGEKGHTVPLIELLNERKKRQALEHELEQLKEPKRWWQF